MYIFIIKSLLFSIFLLLYTSSLSQTFKNDSIRSFVNTSLDLIRSNAIDTSNMKVIESTLYDQAKDLDSVSELAPLYIKVFELLNDHHGGF